MEKTSQILPNTTQIPNIILDEWLTRLSDCEFKILIVIVRQTLGWVMDDDSGRRKERDWLSMSQLGFKTGYGRTKISQNIKSLVEVHRLIEATDLDGNILDTAEKRKNNRSRIFYRLTLKDPEPTLFDKPRRVQKVNIGNVHVQKMNTQKVNTTKETQLYKRELATDESVAPVDNVGTSEKKPSKPPSDHTQFIDFFYRAADGARGVKTIITGADAKMLKQAIDRGISRNTLEQAAVFFLYDPSFREFAPTIRTLLSAGIITGIMNKMQNGADFWKRLDDYSGRRGIQSALAGDPKKIAESTSRFLEMKKALTTSLTMPRQS